MPLEFVNFLKSRLIFNIFSCYWMFINKLSHNSRVCSSKSERCLNVKSLAFFIFIMKTKIFIDFQICISVPLIKQFRKHQYSELFNLKLDSHLPNNFFIVCINDSPSKMLKNAFYFILKALFVFNIFKSLSWLFAHVEKMTWLER